MPADHQTRQHLLNKAGSAISRTLGDGVPFLRFGDDDGAIKLAYRRPGELIDDQDCSMVYQAIEAGVFQRMTKVSDKGVDLIYLRICSLDEMQAFLPHIAQGLSDLDVEAIPMDCAFQKMQCEDARKSAERQIPVQMDDPSDLPEPRAW